MSSLADIDEALRRIRRGEMVLVVDDEDRENEGDLTMAASWVTPEAINFMLRWARGLVCMPCDQARLDELEIPPMVPPGQAGCDTAFTVSIDHLDSGSGIGAADRATTIRSVLDPTTRPTDLIRPGHVFPLRARPGGVLERRGHTEAAVDLARMAGLYPAGILCEIVDENKMDMARVPELTRFAKEHGLLMISIAELVRYRRQKEKLVKRVAEARIPTPWGDFTCYVYESLLDGEQHVAMVRGAVQGERDVLVRVHSECLTGDVFRSMRCDCGTQLDRAMERIAEADLGVVVYLRGHEGRGIGIGHKIRAYGLQEEEGLDTIEANEALGLPVDSREYGIGAQILNDLGITTMQLITNNPSKFGGLEGFGLEITGRVSIPVEQNEHNEKYLRTKMDHMGHLLEGMDD